MYHNRYRKTEQFESLPDEVKAVFEKHVNAHKAMLQEEQQQQQAAQQPQQSNFPHPMAQHQPSLAPGSTQLADLLGMGGET